MINTVNEIGTPSETLNLIYLGLAAAIAWGVILGAVVAWITSAILGGRHDN